MDNPAPSAAFPDEACNFAAGAARASSVTTGAANPSDATNPSGEATLPGSANPPDETKLASAPLAAGVADPAADAKPAGTAGPTDAAAANPASCVAPAAPDGLSESLLDAWVATSISIINERVVSLLTYKESLVCRELKRAGAVVGGNSDGLTATELCGTTRIGKSQMNGILTSLEQKGVVVRTRSASDRRRIEVLLDASPKGLYGRQHAQIVEIVDEIAERLGLEKARETTSVLYELAEAAASILPSGTSRAAAQT